MKKFSSVVIFVAFLVFSCTEKTENGKLHFTILPVSHTNIDFKNSITENDSVNMFTDEYTYMGGGVGVGDFNRDGLPDLFFAGNQVSSKLYLNKGNMQFEDITKKAGLSTDTWCTGVSVIDINNDGWPDIYVCVSGIAPGSRRKNLLYINQHDLTFKEEAAEYGLADTSYSTQAVFFDYDKDGRMDMYLLNHNLKDFQPNNIRDVQVDSNSLAADKLYHNEGIPPGMNHPVFKDVSKQAGIVEDGNGLGVVVSDFNGDGYPDIYVANDYIRNDLLWLNNKNGTFSNCISSAMKHQSYSSMGTDAADINNDQHTDVISLDMQPETNERKKMMYSFLSDQRHQLEMSKGYQPEFIHNMLQLNNGNREINNREEPFFSEIGEMAGIAETDWSWSVLIADFDNDGWKDVHVANGMGRDPTNIDFLEYKYKTVVSSGINENNVDQRKVFMDHLSTLGEVPLRNYLYRNRGGWPSFEDVSAQAGINQKSVSNGAVYVDLDNDGDLDIVTNNINGDAFIMRNDLNSPDSTVPKKDNYLTLKLNGDSLNTDGIGSTVYAYSKGLTQMAEQYPVRGYLSSVDSRIHFGAGNAKFDSIKIVWPDRKMRVILHPQMNQILTVNYKDAGNQFHPDSSVLQPIFKDITTLLTTDFLHKETLFYDYAFQPLIPQKFSQEGPFICTGDVNGDGREDFFIGGAYKQSGKIFLQNADGTFTGKDLVSGTKNEEDMQATFFDADGDKDLDLLIVSGSTEFDPTSSYYRPRLYLNDGKGNFTLDDTAFSPLIRTEGKCVAIADYDGDGAPDIFIGGRVSLGTYPEPPRSYLLHNVHGKFIDVTASVCPALENPGLLNAAAWVDLDNDKIPELVIAGDWMPIRIFKYEAGKLVETTNESGLENFTGFWRSLAFADVNHDGRMDIIAGNIGLNTPFHINDKQPAEMVAKDFDGNGVVEPILCYYIKDNDGNYKLNVGISRDNWAMQMPSIKKTYELNESYSTASMETLLPKEMMDGALVLSCKEPQSGYFENDGKGKFTFHPFAAEAQEAPVNAIVTTDINGDGNIDIIIAGNEYQTQVMAGRYDASYGLVLTGNGKGTFTPMSPVTSGLIIDGDVRDLKLITTKKQKVLLAAINDAKMKAYSIRLSK